MQHRLYFLPEPQGHGLLRETRLMVASLRSRPDGYMVRPGRGCRVRTKERGAEMEAPPRRIDPTEGPQESLSI
jgi:hypothetical protein